MTDHPGGAGRTAGRVLFALVSGGAGGGQRIALSVARALTGLGYRIVALAPEDGPSLEAFRSLGAQTLVVGPLRSHGVAKIVRLARLIRGSAIACVYTHTTPVPESIVGLAAKLAGKSLVIHRHSHGHLSPRRARRTYQRTVWRKVLRSAAEVICVSEQVRSQVQTVAGREGTLVPNGVCPPPRDSARSANGSCLVGCVGRLDPNKRVEDFLEAAALVAARRPTARFLVAGAGTAGSGYEQGCRHLATRLGLDGKVTFTGELADAREAIGGLDIVVVPSVLEGHPIVLLEAMAVGAAVVATDIPGCRETFTHGTEGLLVPPRSPEAIAEAVVLLLDSPQLRARLGAGARDRITGDFSEQRMLERIVPLVTAQCRS